MKKACFFMFALTISMFNYSHAMEKEFSFKAEPIDSDTQEKMVYTWHPDSPVPLEDLRFIVLNHYDFDGNVQTGEIVVHKAVVNDVKQIFEKLFQAHFPIESIKLVDNFDGSDMESMQANNTSAFYARKVAGTERWSNHSFGCAIDINPLINPYSSPKTKVTPKEGEPYLDRTQNIPGMIKKATFIYEIFKELGWQWGGECFVDRDGVIDRHHFQKIIPGLNKNTN